MNGTPNEQPAPSIVRPVSLKVIAAHLGLSTAAVSRVISRSPAARSIPERTQQKILAAALEFGYQPNLAARSLRNRRTFTVGVMVPEVSEGYATLVLSGIERVLLQEDFFYFVVSHRHRTELIERYRQLLLARSIEGLIALDTPLTQSLHVPTVTVSGHHEPLGVTNIQLNHVRAAALAIEHLSGLGHRQIAVIRGQEFSADTQPRWKAIRTAMTDAGLTLDPQLVVQLQSDVPVHEPGYRATQRLLASGARFTALFAFNDISAIGAIRALREAGLNVPGDVSVVGFDDVQSAAFQNPGLTTVRQPLEHMGMLAAQTVLEHIRARLPQTRSTGTTPDADAVEMQHVRLMVEPELIVRGSTAAVLSQLRSGTRR